jgi:hypothetical protein
MSPPLSLFYIKRHTVLRSTDPDDYNIINNRKIKSEFGLRKLSFRGSTILPESLRLNQYRIQMFLEIIFY